MGVTLESKNYNNMIEFLTYVDSLYFTTTT